MGLTSIFTKALEDSEIWFHVNFPEDMSPSSSPNFQARASWQRPLSGTRNCNVSSSWQNSLQIFGVSWLVRNESGETLVHSRRDFSNVTSQLHADLLGVQCAVDSMRDMTISNVTFKRDGLERDI